MITGDNSGASDIDWGWSLNDKNIWIPSSVLSSFLYPLKFEWVSSSAKCQPESTGMELFLGMCVRAQNHTISSPILTNFSLGKGHSLHTKFISMLNGPCSNRWGYQGSDPTSPSDSDLTPHFSIWPSMTLMWNPTSMLPSQSEPKKIWPPTSFETIRVLSMAHSIPA